MTDSALLTPRWEILRPHAEQLRLCTEDKRFKLVPAGRRSGKTERAKRHVVRQAFANPGHRFLCGAPTHLQAKTVFWKDLLALVPSWALAARPNHTELRITLIQGAEIVVAGMDQPQRIEGVPWHGVVLDEYGNMKSSAWPEHVYPTLSETHGWAWLIGVPEGRNHYYDLTVEARKDEKVAQWGIYSWPSSDIMTPEEIAAAKHNLDELTYRQEYEASFVNFAGQAYYAFSESTHCARLKQNYNPRDDIAFCFDFNLSPGVACIVQEMELPLTATAAVAAEPGNDLPFKHTRRYSGPTVGTAVIGEVYIPRNSNTPAVCRKLAQDWKDHQGNIFIYGDPTGGNQGTAKLEGSDWDLVKRELKKEFGQRIHFRVAKGCPAPRARVNAMNSRIRAGDGTIHLMVDGSTAPHVVQDLEGVRLLEGGSGEIDKVHDPKLTHISDALGYYVVANFPTTKLPASTSEVIHV